MKKGFGWDTTLMKTCSANFFFLDERNGKSKLCSAKGCCITTATSAKDD